MPHQSETDRLRELEARVALRTAELAASNKELEAFCYAVSHDLRAPLRSIDGFAYALMQDYGSKLDEDGVEFIDRIRSAAKRMDDLISALLSLSRLTTVEMEPQTIEVSELAHEVVSELNQRYADRPPAVSIQSCLTVRGDRRMLRAVLENLFGNAFKFSASVPHPKIEFGLHEEQGCFYVRDNGVGFDMTQSSKLFQPFERMHGPREFPGSGIGLATVLRIVRKHGGTVRAEAEVGKGATFYFTLNAP